MTVKAALTTGRGTGAISTIEVFGDSSKSAIRKIFKTVGEKTASFEPGQILIGSIADGKKVIDQVTLGCEGPENFAIHCHGNPLIVEMIMELLQRHGAQPVAAEQLLAETLAANGQLSTIAIEAKLAQANAKTIEGTRLIANQIDGGLTETAQRWLDDTIEISLNKVKAEANTILQTSKTARLVIYGCTAVLTGPPNSGKSTLLNYLAGRQKAIVTDIKGTTRDWVDAECRIGSLSVTMIDTAGVDENDGGASTTLRNAATDDQLSGFQNTIEQTAHERTTEILKSADLVLLVLDLSQSKLELDSGLLDGISNKNVITVLNKADLPAKLDIEMLPKFPSEPVRISAKEGKAIDNLADCIQKALNARNIDFSQPACFTNRQESLFEQLVRVESKYQATSIITELLKGRLRV